MKSPIFEHSFVVNEKAENYIRHVNNLRYLEWFIDTAIEHSESLGWGMAVCKEMGLAWVAKSHSIDYISPAYQKDELVISTWIDKITPTRITRQYNCKRLQDNQLIATAHTVWVLVDYDTGKPKSFPQEIKSKFESILLCDSSQ